MALDPRFALCAQPLLRTDPLAPAASVIAGDRWRVTVLTERLLRLEYAAGGDFEDRPTQVVLDRAFPTPDFKLTRKGAGILVRTPALTLEYDGGPFSTGGLVVTPTEGATYHQVWRFGEVHHETAMPLNLGGTARTLDAVDGPCPLEPGLASTQGVAVLDDSRSLALDDDGWVAPHRGDLDLYVGGHGFVDELEEGLTAIAAPIRGADGAVVASLSASGPTARIPRDRLASLGKLVAEQAAAVSTMLGFSRKVGAA